MMTADRRLRGIFGRLFGGWLERANYDWGCTQIDLPESEVFEERLVCEGDLPSQPRKLGRYRSCGH